MTVPLPQGLDWYLWRLLSSPRLAVSLAEVEDRWTVEDMLDAHETLDVWEDLEAKMHEGT